MDYKYVALLGAILVVVFLLARWVVRAHRRFGPVGAWMVILIEAAGVGGLVYLCVKYLPGMADTWIGEQLILAIVGIGLAIILGGGLVLALGRR